MRFEELRLGTAISLVRRDHRRNGECRNSFVRSIKRATELTVKIVIFMIDNNNRSANMEGCGESRVLHVASARMRPAAHSVVLEAECVITATSRREKVVSAEKLDTLARRA